MVNKNSLVDGMISIIIPVYNAEKYLHRCLESIINQSYRNIEVILTNDGSTDNSGRICDEHALKDKRITVIHTENKGPAAARNRGIENSKGEFIFFIDADDFIDSNALSLLIEGYNKHKADIVVGDFKIENHKANLIDTTFLLPGSRLLTKHDIVDYVRGYLKKPTGYSLFIYTWGKLFKSSIIKDNNVYFDPDMRIFEDITFNFQYLGFVHSAYYLKNRVYTYVISDNFTSAGMNIYDKPLGYKLALENIGGFLRNNGINENIIEKEIGNACISFAIRIMIRFFTLKRNVSLKHLYKLISSIINDSDIRHNLQFYSPKKGESKILPTLMKLKLVWLIVLVCKYKANKRYKKV